MTSRTKRPDENYPMEPREGKGRKKLDWSELDHSHKRREPRNQK